MTATETPVPALQVKDLCAWQRDLQVLFEISLHVPPKGIVALIGANGAGKSSLLDALAGLIRASGSVCLNSVELLGEKLSGQRPAQIARAGLALVPEGRRLFASLSVEENLLIGVASGRTGHWNLDSVYALFPALRDKRHAPSGALSGGQQQQVAIGRGLMSNPQVLLCDEISLGLSPAVVRSIYDQIPAITAHGTALVLVEQNIALVLEQAHYVYVLREGKIVLEGEPGKLNRAAISQAYFGVSTHD